MTLHANQKEPRTACMNCGAERLVEFIDLGLQPNGNNFLAATDAAAEPLFPMAMMVCEDCWQVQIAHFPSPEFLFAAHPYVTGLNVPIVRHFQGMAKHIVDKFDIQPNELAIDIGCNDGTLLKAFAANGLRILGVDPGQRTGELARAAGITVCQSFWNRETAASILQLNLRPRVITATAVFYHIPDLHDFIEGLRLVMARDTVFVVQCVSMKDVLEKNQFDHFYHEHSCIHAVGPLSRLFAAHGLRPLDVEQIDVHGGSFILYVGRKDHPMATSANVDAFIETERRSGLYKTDTYFKFADRVRQKRDALKALLADLKAKGKTVYGLGAPVKGSTLLNYCGIGPELVPCLAEVNRFKIGTVAPGSHIPVVDERTLSRQPDYYLVLSWNFIDFFVDKYRDYLAAGGRFIVPVPHVAIVGPEGKETRS